MATKKTVKKQPRKHVALRLKKVKRSRSKQTERKMINEPRADFAPDVEKKLSAKIIVGKRIGKIDAPQDLFTVIGIATGTKTGQSNYGEWVGLRGQFEVVRADDGKVLHAPLMILPDAAMAMIPPFALPCEFAFRVRVVPSLNGAGFEYEVTALVGPRSHDPLAELRQTVANRG